MNVHTQKTLEQGVKSLRHLWEFWIKFWFEGVYSFKISVQIWKKEQHIIITKVTVEMKFQRKFQSANKLTLKSDLIMIVSKYNKL